MPFADISLIHATMLFLAICQGFMQLGTSVLSTNMSDFSTMAAEPQQSKSLIMCLRGKTTMSSLSCLGPLFILRLYERSLMISFSFNLLIDRLNLFACTFE